MRVAAEEPHRSVLMLVLHVNFHPPLEVGEGGVSDDLSLSYEMGSGGYLQIIEFS